MAKQYKDDYNNYKDDYNDYNDDYNKGYDTFAKVSAIAAGGGMLVGAFAKGIAKRNLKKAQRIYDEAYDRYKIVYHDFEYNKIKTQQLIAKIVSLKKNIMVNDMKFFLNAYKRLNPKIKFQNSAGLEELHEVVFDQGNFKKIKKTITAYQLYDERKLGSKTCNVALLMVQDGTIFNLASSMWKVIDAGKIDDLELKRQNVDNIKIQSISAIAQFSSVAIEYGISNISDAFRSGEQLSNIKVEAAKLDEQKELLEIKITEIKAINEYAQIHLSLLNRFSPLINKYVYEAVHIIKSKDNLFHFGRIKQKKFTSNELEILAYTLSLMQTVKTVIDSPIIAKDGNVYMEDFDKFDNAQKMITLLEEDSKTIMELPLNE